ncbi:hypothetical protein ACWENS_05500 [Streptomyces sp. NPDC004532]
MTPDELATTDTCDRCGRRLKRPTVDGLGPVCRRKRAAERAADQEQQQ